MDPRIKILAKNLVNYSCKVQPGERVLIHGIGTAPELLVKQIVQEVYDAGGLPFVDLESTRIQRQILLQASKEQFELMAKWEAMRMNDMDAYIGIRGTENAGELSDVPHDQMELYMKYYSHPVHHDIRVPKTKWVVLRYPNYAMAQLANMSLDAFEDFYFSVCNLDYAQMSKAMDPLKELMEKTDKVRIVGPGTDLNFSIKDIPVVKCDGGRNIPDGEVYTAPVKDSVNGTLAYNAPALYQGFTYENISFTFKEGKIIEAEANDSNRLNQILDTDEGARYIGEFSLGVNPNLHKPMKDTLFDEKIGGSFHFTPGNDYKEASNGNQSAIHWDLVCIQTPEYGGGEIYFDDVLIRKDGKFVLDELKALNG